MSSYEAIARRLMQNNFKVSKDISILVLTDNSTGRLATEFCEALRVDGWKVDFHMMEDRNKSGEEPPADTAAQMLNYDLVFCLTKHSLTHTVARKNASEQGINVVTMPGITDDMFLHGAINADYKRVEQETLNVTKKLTDAKQIVIRTTDEYELTVPVAGRKGIPSTGVFYEKGASGNLPSGEAYIAPLEGLAEGRIEINGSIAGIGIVDEPIVLTVEKGSLVNASGEGGEELLRLLGNGDGRLLGELGIGTNYAARITGNILEDEKAYNTVHVAFGSNDTFGGTIRAGVHIDCVTKNPKLEWKF